jgi:predicted alpha/beta hydrolase family esterase
VSKSFLILHGIENHRPPQHWQFLLAAALVEQGHDVRYPGLPAPDSPNIDEWLSVLDAELAAMIGPSRTVICHSLACLLWFHAAGRGISVAVDRVLLVAPPASDRVPDNGASFRLLDLDAGAVLRSTRRELTIVCSDCDPYNPLGAQSLYADPLGLTAIVISGADHITPDSGFGAWPFSLDWCLHDRQPSSASRQRK